MLKANACTAKLNSVRGLRSTVTTQHSKTYISLEIFKIVDRSTLVINEKEMFVVQYN